MGLLGRLTSRLRSGANTTNYDFDHYTDASETVKQLKRERKHEEALALLDWCMDQTEAEAGGVAPWYYEQAAILYRKEERYRDEVAVLERYERQNHANGSKAEKLATRLAKAKKLADSNQK
ncbi:hypothetical protein [Halorussus halophilus]|uniref:hypothetical protein n=1 Tax=Halorussus halophilus TaxID=2650975 RepID=UPI0013015ECD|nr:hypothetical protein [Halorussus halophilus]